MNQQIRVRFAPSPTGYLHIGGARTALFNYLFARHTGGTFLLRVEDTDLERSTVESEEAIYEGLRWLGLNWDEGPQVGGEHGPYRQTERVEIYREYAKRLMETGDAYECYCLPEELEEERKAALEKNELPRYSGKCRCLTEEQKKEYESQGRKPVIRFRMPSGEKIIVNDIIRGEVEFNSDDFGDFIIIKSDGVAAYNFAVVIDDALMGMTHVIRGEDHLTNTPRQMMLYQKLGFPMPKFAHISLILGPDRTKLSKRHGNTALEQYEKEGFLPEAMLNFLALLGWSPESNQEIFTLEELIKEFSLERIAKNPAVFNLDKLKWMNAHYIKEASTERIAKLCIPYLQEKNYLGEQVTEEEFAWLTEIVEAVKNRLEHLSQITDQAEVFFVDDFSLEEDAQAFLHGEKVPELMQALVKRIQELPELTEEAIKGVLKEAGKEAGVKGKGLFMAARAALTGKTAGPELHNIIKIIGIQRSVERIRNTSKKVGIDI